MQNKHNIKQSDIYDFIDRYRLYITIYRRYTDKIKLNQLNSVDIVEYVGIRIPHIIMGCHYYLSMSY